MKVRIKTIKEMIATEGVCLNGTSVCHVNYFWAYIPEMEADMPENRIIEVTPTDESKKYVWGNGLGMIQDWMIAEKL